MTIEEAMDVIQTGNEHFGFYGTVRNWADPNEAWPMVVRALLAATEGRVSEPLVRDFLDSHEGARLATGVARRMSHTPSSVTSRVEGLHGHGLHEAIIAEVDSLARAPGAHHIAQRIVDSVRLMSR